MTEETAKYPIGTLAQMAAIPQEARSRMLAELPSILETYSQILEAAPELAKSMKASAPWPINRMPLSTFERAITSKANTGGEWVDDTKGLATVSMSMKRGDTPFFKQTQNLTP